MRLDQVVLVSDDPARVVAFYRALFAARVEAHDEHHTELAVGKGRLRIERGEGGGRGDRHCYALGPAALKRVRRRVGHLSVDVVADEEDHLMVRDPEGRLLELRQDGRITARPEAPTP